MRTQTLLFTIVLGLASTNLLAQACNGFFNLREGARIEYQHFDKKDKLVSTNEILVKSVASTQEGWIATLHSVSTPEKGKDVFESTYEWECNQDGYRVNFLDMMMPEFKEQLDAMDMELSIEGDQLQYPKDLDVGMELPDATITVQPEMSGLVNMTFRYTIRDRKVEGKETVETPAGSYECYRVSSVFEMKSIGNREYRQTEWMAEDVGLVQAESYDKKGKIIGKTLLYGLSGQ